MNPFGRSDFARVIVTGSTTWDDTAMVESVLHCLAKHASLRGHPFQVLTGMADGADAIARDWADALHVQLHAEPLAAGTYPEPMHRYNEELLRLQPDVVIAFKEEFAEDWDVATCIRGTEHMCRIACEAGIPVYLNGWHRLSGKA